MILKTSRLLLEVVLVALAAVAAFGGVLAWQLSKGPVSLDFVSPYVISALNPPSGDFRIKLDTTVLTWVPERRALEIHAIDVRAVDRQGKIIAEAPEVSVAFSGLALLRGMLAPTRLIVIRPQLQLVRSETGEIHLAVAPSESSPGAKPNAPANGRPMLPLVRQLLQPPQPNQPLGYLEEIRIAKADLTIDDRHLGVSWRAPDASIALARNVVGLRLTGRMAIDVQGRKATISLAGIYDNRDDRLDIGATFQGVEPAVLAGGSPALAALTPFDLAVDGTVRVTMSGDGHIGDVDVDLRSGPGIISPASTDLPRLQIDSLRARAHLVGGLGKVDLEDLELKLADGVTLSASGKTGERSDGRTPFNATLEVHHLPVSRLAHYWPNDAAVGARRWILANITGGSLSEGSVSLAGHVVDGGEGGAWSDSIDVTSVRGALLYEDLAVTYISGLPQVTGIHGSGTFDMTKFDLGIDGGELKNLKVARSRVRITGLDQPEQRADVDVTAVGGLRDALQILDEKRLGYPSALGIKPDATSGRTIVHMRYDLPLVRDLKFDQVKLAANADIKDMVWRDAVLGRDVSNGQLTLKVDARHMEVRGSTDYADIPFNIEWVENFADNVKIRRRLVARGEPRAETLGSFGWDPSKYVQGPLPLKVIYTGHDGSADTVAFDVDLTPADMSIPAIAWQKPAGVRGHAAFTIAMRGGAVEAVEDADLMAPGLTAAGAVGFDPKTGKLVSAKVRKLAVGLTDIGGTLSVAKDGTYQVEIDGAGLDISNQLSPSSGGIHFSPPPMTLSANIGRLYSRPDRFLADATLNVTYNGKDWRSIHFRGRVAHRTNEVGPGLLTIDLSPEGDKRTLSVESEDAGGVIRAFGISDNVIGGKLDISGAIDDSDPDQPLTAKVVMTDYKVKNAPVMARVLTLASLTGISDVLNGRGISFNRMEVPLTKTGPVVKVKDARAVGSELGFTMNGEVNVDSNHADLGGTIVPAYTINSLLGKIPILGTIFVGEKGSGVFAASYTITGPIDAPKVSVNPVATLTPGFLRNIFGVPGGSSQEPEKKNGRPASQEATPGMLKPSGR